MYWSAKERNLSLDGQPVRKLSEYWGSFKTVVFCAEDLQLIKGVGRARRRFLDFLIAQTHGGYLQLLQRYTRALRSRNALLKQSVIDEIALDSFTAEVVKTGGEITRLRCEVVPKLSPLAQSAYARISGGDEELRFEYRPSVKTDFTVQLNQARDRERSYGSTLVGPHRDELDLLLNDRPAAQFASEGQKRTLAIALKVAQAEYLLGLHGSAPVLLIDDVMGELDLKRRSAFMPLLQRARATGGQVFMTATEEDWPDELGGERHKWRVAAGTLQKAN
jgi:DNA replication and repair protein RecF